MRFVYVLLFAAFTSVAFAAQTLSQTCLILAANAAAADQAVGVIQGYGTPLQVWTIPQSGAPLPTLETVSGSNSNGAYGLIVVVGLVTYDYGGTTGWASAITAAQWTALYNYQTKYKVRMVHLDAFPGSNFGTAVAPGPDGCCNTEEQTVTLTDTTFIPTAGLKSAALSTKGLWHYPATINDPTGQTFSFLTFGTNSQYKTATVAGVRQKLANGAGFREQMAIFLEGGSWSLTTNYICHIWFHWGYRGIYNGYRRLGLNLQVDDFFLDTDIYVAASDPSGIRSRITTADLDNHITWMSSFQATLNPGSQFFLEIGFNGNGNMDYVSNANDSCLASESFNDPIGPEPNAEFKKPVGTGVNSWPPNAVYQYTKDCSVQDPLAAYLQNPAKRDAFGWITHTFTHEDLDNATFYDVNNEIQFNQKHAATLGLNVAKTWSPKGLIPPAITGLHNGDALRAFMTNGIISGVGDNTRPLLRNPTNFHLPLITTVAANGYASFTILPRWASRIYYNCGTMDEDAAEWRALSPTEAAGTAGDIYALLEYEKQGATGNLLGVHRDAYMFHQINLRVTDVGTSTINGITKQRSLLQMWAETVATEFTRLVKWPLITNKQDDLFVTFTNRLNRVACNPKVMWLYNAAGTQITGYTVSAGNLWCSVAIPVSIPAGTVTSLQGGYTEQVGSDPLTVWTWLQGAAKTFTLTVPITL